MLITSSTTPIATSTTSGTLELASDVIQTVTENTVTAIASRTYGLQVNSSGQGVINVPWSDTDTNTFPTTYTWAGGTSSGPTGILSGSMPNVSFGAIPTASSASSGIITTTVQDIGGVKTFYASSTEFANNTSQDGISISGRVGGSTALRAIFTPGILTSSITLTTPVSSGTISINLISGSTSIGAIQYNGTTALAGSFDGGATTPSGTTRLNYGGYFYPTYLNLVGSADTATAATHYFVETGTDGYVRPKTLADVTAEIVTSTAIISALGYTPAPSTTALDDAIAMSIALG